MRDPIRLVAIGVATLALAATGMSVISAAGPPADKLPAEKQALEDAAASLRANAPKGDKAHDPGRPVDTQAEGPPDTGLLGAFNAPISGTEFTPKNAWAGWTDASTYIQVWAGNSPTDPGNGLVFVVRRHGANGILDDSVAPVPALIKAAAAGGPLHIVRVEGDQLIVANPAGREFRFNPASSAFD
jgi:hypothetical protein